MNRRVYNHIDNVELYVGVLGEKKMPGSNFGELGATIAAQQFNAIRDGDRLWYQHAYPQEIIDEIDATSLADIIRRNTDIKNMPENGFFCNHCTVD